MATTGGNCQGSQGSKVIQLVTAYVAEGHKAALATKEAMETWKESHPYALWDDGQNVQMLLIKHTNQKESAQRLATVTI